jgi:hypothetical protein
MIRTERFRGRLLQGTELVLDSLEGHLKSHARGTGAQGEWTGHFEYPPELSEQLVEGNRYRLILIDGRSGHIHLHKIENDPLGRNLVNFHGQGMVRR